MWTAWHLLEADPGAKVILLVNLSSESGATIIETAREADVQVIDYDSSRRRYRPPLQDIGPNGKFAQPSDELILEHPGFRAHNSYAIAMRTLRVFEDALGRRVPWAGTAHQLKIAPHAFVGANAFYSRESEALLFGYFAGESGPVFSSLSHDVVVHDRGTQARADAIYVDGDIRDVLLECGFTTEEIRRCSAALRHEGYRGAVTAAMSRADQGPFLEAGFVPAERLHLLLHSLDELPSPALTAPAQVRRGRRRELDDLLAEYSFLNDGTRRRVEQLFERLSEPDVLEQFVQALEDGAVAPDSDDVDLFFSRLRPQAMPILIRFSEMSETTGVRGRLAPLPRPRRTPACSPESSSASVGYVRSTMVPSRFGIGAPWGSVSGRSSRWSIASTKRALTACSSRSASS